MSRGLAGARPGSAGTRPPSSDLDLLLASLPPTTPGIIVHLVRRPRDIARATRLLRALRTFEVTPSATDDGRVLEAGLRRRSPLARAVLRGVTGVLTVPTDPDTFVSGNSRRTMRKRRNAAIRSGVRSEHVAGAEERAALLRLANEEERRHPDVRYRNSSPDNRDLLTLRHWLLARDADGVPLLLAVVAVDGEWAMLRYFRTLQQTEEATSARFLMMDALVRELSSLGVRALVTTMSPVKLTPGLREFQHRVGFELALVHLPRRSASKFRRHDSRLPISVQKS